MFGGRKPGITPGYYLLVTRNASLQYVTHEEDPSPYPLPHHSLHHYTQAFAKSGKQRLHNSNDTARTV
jgi:hypothetical protein